MRGYASATLEQKIIRTEFDKIIILFFMEITFKYTMNEKKKKEKNLSPEICQKFGHLPITPYTPILITIGLRIWVKEHF